MPVTTQTWTYSFNFTLRLDQTNNFKLNLRSRVASLLNLVHWVTLCTVEYNRSQAVDDNRVVAVPRLTHLYILYTAVLVPGFMNFHQRYKMLSGRWTPPPTGTSSWRIYNSRHCYSLYEPLRQSHSDHPLSPGIRVSNLLILLFRIFRFMTSEKVKKWEILLTKTL